MVYAHTITIWVLQRLAFGADEHQQISLVFHDVACKAKCAQTRDSRPTCTKLCVLNYGQNGYTAVVAVFKTFHNAQLAQLVGSKNARNNEIFYSERSRYV